MNPGLHGFFMPCPVLFSDQESNGRAGKGPTATSRAPLRLQVCRPYALHTIVLRDLYDFLDVISFAQTVKAMGHRVLLDGPFSLGPRDATTNVNQQEIGA